MLALPTDLRHAPPRPAEVANAWETMRRRGPLVHCLTNVVAAQWTANVLLASGASPAMVDHPGEAGQFAGRADALLVNLGILKEPAATAMSRAVAGAAEGGTPWVLDPVGIGGLPWRTSVAKDLLRQAGATIVRGNASEILALAGGKGGRGPESLDAPEDALAAAATLARERHTVVAVSGPVDHLTDGRRLVRVGNGHPWLTRVTVMDEPFSPLDAITRREMYALLGPRPTVPPAEHPAGDARRHRGRPPGRRAGPRRRLDHR